VATAAHLQCHVQQLLQLLILLLLLQLHQFRRQAPAPRRRTHQPHRCCANTAAEAGCS
jgi:hypothetical protein